MDRVSRGYQDPGIGFPRSKGPPRRGQLGSREMATERGEVPGAERERSSVWAEGMAMAPAEGW